MHRILPWVASKQNELIAFLRELVECESPSDDPAAVTRFVDLLAAKTADFARVKRFEGGKFGPNALFEFELPGPRTKRPGRILGVGHSDTVWPIGTLQEMPWREEQGRLWGPGVLDMKAGLAFYVYALRCLRELEIPVGRKAGMWVVSDEEVGSEGSRARTEAMAKESLAVLVLEPGTGLQGKHKTARKGVGDYTIRVKGKAAHAGVDFTSGASAIVELARQIEKVAAFTDLKKGLTVNPGVIRGGTRTNVIAAEAVAEVDIRVARMRDAPALDRKFRALKPVDKRCSIEVEGGVNRPPMERTPGVVKLFRMAQRLADRHLKLRIEESSTGGGSDGNFTAALGVPTLDGIGAAGEGAHAANESILIDRIADRTALLAMLVSELGQVERVG